MLRPCPLTRRQAEILALAARGFAQKQIAYELGLTPPIINHEIEHARAALGAANITQAVVISICRGWIQVEL